MTVPPPAIYDVAVKDIVDEGVVRRLRENPRRKLGYVLKLSEGSKPVVKLYEAAPATRYTNWELRRTQQYRSSATARSSRSKPRS